MHNGCETFRNLGIPEEQWSLLLPGWGQAMANMPEKTEALDPRNVRESCAWSSLSGSLCGQLVRTAEEIARSRDLRAFFHHVLFKLTVLHSTYGNYSTGFANWPVPRTLPEHSQGLFYLLAALSVLPEAVQKYRSMALPDRIIRDTLDLRESVAFYEHVHGVPGLDPMLLAWQRHYASGRIFRLGRFQYKIAELFSFGVMLRRRSGGEKILLAEPGLRFSPDGYAVPDGSETQMDWVSQFEETDTEFRGHAVSPHGFAIQEKAHFPKSEWEGILRRGDILLDMHIPPGGKMTPEAVRDSFAQAFDFFCTRYGGRFVPAIISRSWIFNTQFEELLPDSNIAKLMRRCYLFPCLSTGRDGFFFLFGKEYSDPAEAPHDTSVRRAMLSILERGEKLRLGGMLFLEEDLPDFEKETYRKHFRFPVCHTENAMAQDSGKESARIVQACFVKKRNENYK